MIGSRSWDRPALAEQKEGTREGGGGCLWEQGLLRGRGAGLPGSPRFAPSLWLLGRKRGGAARVSVPLNLGAQVCMYAWDAVRGLRASIAPGASSGVTPESLRNWKWGPRGLCPLPRKDVEDFENSLPHLPPGSSFVVNSFDKWWGRERWERGACLYPRRRRGPGLETWLPPSLPRRGAPYARGHGFRPALGTLALSCLATPLLSPPLFLFPTPHRYRELSGVSFRIFK